MRSSQCIRTENSLSKRIKNLFFLGGGGGGGVGEVGERGGGRWVREGGGEGGEVGEEIISAKNVYYAPGRCAFLFAGDWSGTSDQQEQGRGSIYKQG